MAFREGGFSPHKRVSRPTPDADRLQIPSFAGSGLDLDTETLLDTQAWAEGLVRAAGAWKHREHRRVEGRGGLHG